MHIFLISGNKYPLQIKVKWNKRKKTNEFTQSCVVSSPGFSKGG